MFPPYLLREITGGWSLVIQNIYVLICNATALVLVTACLTTGRTQSSFNPSSRLHVSSETSWGSNFFADHIAYIGPYVTAVGGTTRIDPEVVVPLSGGGFSNYFTTPAYQSDVTTAFVGSLGETYAGMFK